MIRGADPNLDRDVARRLGEEGSRVAPYSTDPAAAGRLAARLKERGIFVTAESVDKVSYCTLWVGVEDRRERLATGSGKTESEALCRAVLNLPEGLLKTR